MKRRNLMIAALVLGMTMSSISPAFAEDVAEVQAAEENDMTPEELFGAAMEYQQQGNMEEGMKLLVQSAEGGFAEAQRILGEFNQSGDFAEPNYEEALKWDQMAADQGHPRATTNLGILYLNGWGIDQDYDKALELFELATELGDEKAPRYAGEMYEQGLGMEADIDKAVSYFEIATERGDLTGTYDLARMYEQGIGVEQDYQKAYELYQIPAERDDHVGAPAQFAIGNLFMQGLGVPQDPKPAMEWFQRAADNGSEEAAGALEQMIGMLKEMGYYGKMVNPERDAMIEAVLDKFIQNEYVDEETGITLKYNLYIPDNYDESQEYPLILFMHDASACGPEATQTLTQGFGALVWATEEDQQEHPAFVLAPQYENVIANDDFTVTEEADVTVRLLESLKESYSIDSGRLYATGQSMGCMTAFELNIRYPDLFAASFYVAGQWDISKLSELEDDTLVYMVSETDLKAGPAITEFEELLETDGVDYASALWNGKWSDEEFNQACAELFDQGKKINLIRFEQETVLPEGTKEDPTLEHLYTWDTAYLIKGVRSWLFEQSK